MLITVCVEGAVRKGAMPRMMSTTRESSSIPWPMMMSGPAAAPLLADSATVILKRGPGTSAPERAMTKEEKAIRKRLMEDGPSPEKLWPDE